LPQAVQKQIYFSHPTICYILSHQNTTMSCKYIIKLDCTETCTQISQMERLHNSLICSEFDM
jgi:hypothetical protein